MIRIHLSQSCLRVDGFLHRLWYEWFRDIGDVFNGMWFIFNSSCLEPASPIPGTYVSFSDQIIWNWNTVARATGYTRYVWAYNGCGYSTPVNLTQSTLTCLICGDPFIISHVAGEVAPVDKTVTYGTVNNIPGELTKCWITSNLGADHQATAVNDAAEASAGWYWQFNRKQGYKHDGTTRTPNTAWITDIIEDSEWLPANDPCVLELGNGWRLPTKTEWTNVDVTGVWTNWSGPWNSLLKMHAAGYLYYGDGLLRNRGSYGIYWSITQSQSDYAWELYFHSSQSIMYDFYKANAFTARCIRDN